MTEVLDLRGGFICTDESDYLNAVANLGQISSADCRQVALSRFHYLDMARNYFKEYEREIENWSNRADIALSV